MDIDAPASLSADWRASVGAAAAGSNPPPRHRRRQDFPIKMFDVNGRDQESSRMRSHRAGHAVHRTHVNPKPLSIKRSAMTQAGSINVIA
jgi:hypothetical protein